MNLSGMDNKHAPSLGANINNFSICKKESIALLLPLAVESGAYNANIFFSLNNNFLSFTFSFAAAESKNCSQ